MNIQFWAADQGACGRYRCELPGGALAARGHTVRVNRQLDLRALPETDVVVGQRICKSGPSQLWQAMADSPRKPLMVYELDDDVWALQFERHNPAAREWGPRLRDVQRNLAVADAVTVTTAALAEVVSAHTSAPVHVVPNAVPDELLDGAHVGGTPPWFDSTYGDRPLGWGGSPTHDGDWEHDGVARTVVRWADRSGHALMFLGLGVPEPVSRALANLSVHSRQVTNYLGWTRDWTEYYQRVSRFWVGLAPLAPTTFNRSKSDLKVLEYAALGVPWVASGFGPYAATTEARGGIRAHSPVEWRGVLEDMSRGQGTWERYAAAGARWARSRTVSAVLPRWEAALKL